MVIGVGLAMLAGLLLTVTIALVLWHYTAIPLWGCFAIVGGVMAACAAGLLIAGYLKADEVRVIPPQTAETLKENVEWIEKQT
jgi:hypothetical protein